MAIYTLNRNAEVSAERGVTAMQGQVTEARTLFARGLSILEELEICSEKLSDLNFRRGDAVS